MLGPAGNLEPIDAGLTQLVVERNFQLEDGLFPRGPLGCHLRGQLAVFLRLQELEGEIFQLGLDAGHTEAMGERRIDFPSLQCDPAPPVGRKVLQGAHVVQPVAELDDDDPCVLGDRQQELPVVLDLLLSRGVERQAGDLG
jgi:hypothetical protein